MHDHNHDEHTHHHLDDGAVGYTVRLKGKLEVAEGTMAFYFEKPEGLTFKAGQHMDIKLIDPPETDEKGTARHFTIVSSPNEPDLVITTRLRDSAFKRILRNMDIGQSVIIGPPHGAFFLHDDASKPAIFLAGGIGITPVYSILKDVIERNLPHKITVFYSNRRPEDAPFLYELESLARHHPNFTLVATMTEPEKSAHNWQGQTGIIDRTMLEAHLHDLPSAGIYYLSGPSAMVAAMRTLLHDAKVNESNVRTEEFTGY
jgi:ferredoxin-NADP reductase